MGYACKLAQGAKILNGPLVTKKMPSKCEDFYSKIVADMTDGMSG